MTVPLEFSIGSSDSILYVASVEDVVVVTASESCSPRIIPHPSFCI